MHRLVSTDEGHNGVVFDCKFFGRLLIEERHFHHGSLLSQSNEPSLLTDEIHNDTSVRRYS